MRYVSFVDYVSVHVVLIEPGTIEKAVTKARANDRSENDIKCECVELLFAASFGAINPAHHQVAADKGEGPHEPVPAHRPVDSGDSKNFRRGVPGDVVEHRAKVLVICDSRA